jgi:hypothetical protein
MINMFHLENPENHPEECSFPLRDIFVCKKEVNRVRLKSKGCKGQLLLPGTSERIWS